MTLQILDIIRHRPGCRMRDILDDLGIAQTDRDATASMGYRIGHLYELGVIAQDHGGWYAPPDNWETLRQAKQEARLAAKAQSRQDTAALRTANRERRSNERLQHAATRATLRAANRERHATERAQRAAAAVAARARSLEERRAVADAAREAKAQRSHENLAAYERLAAGLTLQRIADLVGRSASAAQAWREGRAPVPDYVIEALQASIAYEDLL